MFSLMCFWINGWINNGETGVLRRHRSHYEVIVMPTSQPWNGNIILTKMPYLAALEIVKGQWRNCSQNDDIPVSVGDVLILTFRAENEMSHFRILTYSAQWNKSIEYGPVTTIENSGYGNFMFAIIWSWAHWELPFAPNCISRLDNQKIDFVNDLCQHILFEVSKLLIVYLLPCFKWQTSILLSIKSRNQAFQTLLKSLKNFENIRWTWLWSNLSKSIVFVKVT